MYGRCTVLGATLRGVEAIPVDVEVAVSNGLPGFSIVGMGDASVQEARERVRAALRSSGFQMPSDKIVVNLAPSSLRKTGSGLDLPIAVALLAATGQIDRACIENRLFVGELSLEGFVRGVAGSLAFALCAKKRGCSLVCAEDGETEPKSDVGRALLERANRLFTPPDANAEPFVPRPYVRNEQPAAAPKPIPPIEQQPSCRNRCRGNSRRRSGEARLRAMKSC